MNKLPTADLKWSGRDFLDFSFNLGINEAFEGTWASGDPSLENKWPSDVSFELEWLKDDPGDENNNSQMITGILNEISR